MKKIILPTTAKFVEKTIRFKKTDGFHLIIDASVVQKFIQYQQKNHFNYEAGGLLLGRHLKGCQHLAVDYVSEPQPKDKRTRYSFFRGTEHQNVAHQYWENSNGTCAYLGNWHTHPEPYPTPSQTDMNDWLNVLANDIYEGNYLYFLIIGTLNIVCWEGQRNNCVFTKLGEFTL